MQSATLTPLPFEKIPPKTTKQLNKLRIPHIFFLALKNKSTVFFVLHVSASQSPPFVVLLVYVVNNDYLGLPRSCQVAIQGEARNVAVIRNTVRFI